MHPYLMGEVIRQRTAERQEEARNGRLVRALRKTRRRGTGPAAAPDTFVVPPIPDYVDGTFRTAGDTADQVPAGRAGR